MNEFCEPDPYRRGRMLSTLDLKYLKLYAHVDQENNILGVFVLDRKLDSDTKFVCLYMPKQCTVLNYGVSKKTDKELDLAHDIVLDLQIADIKLYYESYDIWYLQ